MASSFSTSSLTGTPIIRYPTAGSASSAIASSSLTTSSIKDPTAGSTPPPTVSSSSSSNSKAYLLSLPRELLWTVLDELIPYQREINVCEANAYEFIVKDNPFDALSKVCKTFRREIEAWFSAKRSSVDRLSGWKIFPTKTPFVMHFDFVLYGNRSIASAHFTALRSFLRGTTYQTIVRHLVIITRVLEKRTCPYILLNALWPCLKGMKDLEKVDLILGRAGIWHNICKDSWLIPELEKGPKIQYLTWWSGELPNGENTCRGSNKSREEHEEETKEESKEVKVMESVGFDDKRMDPKGALNHSENLAELKRRVNELRWNQSPLLGALRD